MSANPLNQMPTMREQFEQWAVSKSLNIEPAAFGGYADPATNAAWLACDHFYVEPRGETSEMLFAEESLRRAIFDVLYQHSELEGKYSIIGGEIMEAVKKHMGGTSTRKDAGDVHSLNTSADHVQKTGGNEHDRGEISVGDPWPVCGRCEKPLWRTGAHVDKHYYEPCHTCEPDALPKPVSVDLDAGARAIDRVCYGTLNPKECAKACAEAWGLGCK